MLTHSKKITIMANVVNLTANLSNDLTEIGAVRIGPNETGWDQCHRFH